MDQNNANGRRRAVNKLYGGLNMSWLGVILYAVGTALLTAAFLIVPIFKDTSFERMGVTMEAWVFFAVIVMANCKSPLESAVKTFVFFLISQPLIYLFQVPFSWLGWGLFRFYKTWFIWTLLTFPMAFVGWYITKKNWLSVLIFAPVLAFLGYTCFESGTECVRHFPHLLVTLLFCVLQITLYITVFFPKPSQKIVGALIPILTAAAFAALTPRVALTTVENLPGSPSFSPEATISVEDASVANIQLTVPEDGMVYVKAQRYGVTEMRVIDGETETRFIVEVYDDQGTDRVRITAAEP